MKQLLSSFPWHVPVYCFLGWLAILILHTFFIVLVPKDDTQIDISSHPAKKRITEDGNNLFACSWWNLGLIAIAHFIRIWAFIPWVSFIISAVFSLPSIIAFVAYFFTGISSVFFDRTFCFRDRIILLISIFSNFITTSLLAYTTYSIYTLYIG